MTVLQSCQKESESFPQEEPQNYQSDEFAIVGIQEKDDVINYIVSLTNENLSVRLRNPDENPEASRTEEGNLEVEVIDLENVFTLSNDTGSKNYAFKMSSDKNEKRPHFINLVVQEIGNYRSMMILKYLPDKKWLDDPKEFSDYVGEIHYYNPQGNYVGKTKNKGQIRFCNNFY